MAGVVLLGIAGALVMSDDPAAAAAWLPARADLPGNVVLEGAHLVPAAPRIEFTLSVKDGPEPAEFKAALRPKGQGPPPFACAERHCLNFHSDTGQQQATPEPLARALTAIIEHVRRVESQGLSLGSSGQAGLAWLLRIVGLIVALAGVVGTILLAETRSHGPRERRGLAALTLLVVLIAMVVAAALRIAAVSPGLSEDERVQLASILADARERTALDEGLPQPAQDCLLWLADALGFERVGMQALVLALSLVGVLAAIMLCAVGSPRSIGVAVSGLVAALCPALITYGANLRGYTLGCTASVLAVLALSRAGSRPRSGWLLFILFAGVAALAHPLAALPPAAALLVQAYRAIQSRRSVQLARAVAAIIGLAAIILALAPRLALALSFHEDSELTLEPVLPRLGSMLEQGLGLPLWVAIAAAVLAGWSLRGRWRLAGAALLAGLVAPLVLSSLIRIEGRHLLFAAPFVAVLAGAGAVIVVQGVGEAIEAWQDRCGWTRRLRAAAPALGVGLLLAAGIAGQARALPRAIDHETRAAALLGRHLAGQAGPMLVAPHVAVVPVIDAYLDLEPERLVRVEFEAIRKGERIEWRCGAADNVAAVGLQDLGAAISEQVLGGQAVHVVAKPAQLGDGRPGPGCEVVQEQAPFRLWRCSP